jgi:hypothetical protein
MDSGMVVAASFSALDITTMFEGRSVTLPRTIHAAGTCARQSPRNDLRRSQLAEERSFPFPYD